MTRIDNAHLEFEESVSGLVLAGGRGQRMGGLDKGLVPLAGRPMIEHVLDAIRLQVTNIIISANRNLDRYQGYGCPVVSDEEDGYPGPLAGVLAGLKATETPFLVTVPCDAPMLAPDLVRRLQEALRAEDADLAVASDGDRLQPVFMLLSTRLAPSLNEYLAGGGRKIDTWYGRLRLAVADLSDRPETFVNVNDPTERERVEKQLSKPARG
jgi:molybdopterin-guanine dinucleotide biosynthesis protein A